MIKKYLSAKIFITILTIFIFLFPLRAIERVSGRKTDQPFSVKSDGIIEVNGLIFKNFLEYFNSDYFKKSGKRCGTRIAKSQTKSIAQSATGDCDMNKTVIKNEYYPTRKYIIPVVFHIIYNGNGTGNISDQKVMDQMEILNEDFRAITGTMGDQGHDTKIEFQLIDITRTENNTWFEDFEEIQYKNRLGWDQDYYLNIYSNTASGYLGYSYLPQELPLKAYDGVVINYEVVGGRNNGADPYDQGRTLVHEIGHYLGLLHTFEDYGCYDGYYAGDLIKDTNSESFAHYDCIQTATCGTEDPIHNYMNYTDDICMYQFTPEQANRLICTLVNYRPLIFNQDGTEPLINITSPNGGENWTVGEDYNITWISNGTIGNVKIEYSINNGSSWNNIVGSTSNDGSYIWTVPDQPSTNCLIKISEAADGDPKDISNDVFTIAEGIDGAPILSVNRIALNFTLLYGTLVATNQEIVVTNSGTGTLKWNVNKNANWLLCTPNSGSNTGSISVSVQPQGLSLGTYIDTIIITAPNTLNPPHSVIVTLKIKSTEEDQPPFGEFSTPIDGSTVMSSIPVTGWALDDVGVESVKIYINNDQVGTAVFVEGARPDIEQAFPTYTANYRAGWGYMLLTNVLPEGNQTISAKVFDNTGNQTLLGTKTIIINNASAVKPFGAIDTPAQGGIADGRNYRNQGWVLTPPPNKIPEDGSTIKIYVNGVPLGNATYNIYRSDIAQIFPGYANSNGALAYFELDTTGFENGVHTIQWTATDNQGNIDGIGSRYFKIQNTENRLSGQGASGGLNKDFPEEINEKREDINLLPEEASFISVKKGFDENIWSQFVFPDYNGEFQIEIQELERLEIQLWKNVSSGFLVLGNQLKKIPTGSYLDIERKKFYWSPGPGFLGDYSILFRDKDKVTKRKINIKILPLNE